MVEPERCEPGQQLCWERIAARSKNTPKNVPLPDGRERTVTQPSINSPVKQPPWEALSGSVCWKCQKVHLSL